MNNAIINDIEEKILEELFPWLMVMYDVDELYTTNPKKATEIIMQKLDEEAILDKKDTLLVNKTFSSQKEQFLLDINNVSNEFFKENVDMFLFKVVSIFEGSVNSFLNEELQMKVGFKHRKANEILSKLSTQDKLDWLLTLICGDSYIGQEDWGVIKNFITTRNFFIHQKPIDYKDYYKFKERLTKQAFIDFLDACTKCNLFLLDRKSEETQEYNNRLDKARQIFINRK